MEQDHDEAPVVVRAYAGKAAAAARGGGDGGGRDNSDGGSDGGDDGLVCVGDAIATDDQDGFLR
jgi:hypothetical protein